MPRNKAANLYARVYGCSHSSYFHCNEPERKRLDDSREWPIVGGKVIASASVAGFRPKASTLSTKEIITKGCVDANRLVLAFGQVDLELGYYYRNAVKGEAIKPRDYVDWLADIYAAFVSGIAFPKDNIAIKGVNLTVLTDPDFTFSYAKRIVSRRIPKQERPPYSTKLRQEILSEDAQNEMSLHFNEKVQEFCADIGCRYFDVNDFLAKKDENGIAQPKLGVDRTFIPGRTDHHIADSIPVREAHLSALLKAFKD